MTIGASSRFMIHVYIDQDNDEQDNDPTLVIKCFILEHVRSGQGVQSLAKRFWIKAVSLPITHRSLSPSDVKIPFSKLIYCTCIFPSLYLNSLPFFVSLLESLCLARLLNAERSASYKARASVLSRGSLGYRGISGQASPDVHTKIRCHNYKKILLRQIMGL